MPSEWREVCLADIGVITTGRTPRTGLPGLFGGPVPFVTPTDMDGRRTIAETLRGLTEAGVAAIRSAAIPAGAVMVSCIGSDMGKVAIAGRRCATNQQINSIVVGPGASAAFVYYNLSTRKEELQHLASGGSAQPILNKSDFSRLSILLPPLSEQRAIARIIGTLDDEIELNRRQNETLEALARALFKSWFVDFDPVRAKAEGREPVGMDEETAALFPERLVDSELGPVPEGWRSATIGEVAEVIDCLHTKKPARVSDGGRLYLHLGNIRDDGLLDLADSYCISDADYAVWVSRIEATEGDCLITNVGRVGAVAQVPQGVRAAIGRNMTAVRPRPSFPYPTFLVELMLSAAMREEIERRTDSGTILDALNVRSIPRLWLVRPTPALLGLFEERARSLRRRMEHNLVESGSLAAIRDALLPKLLSGELRVGGVVAGQEVPGGPNTAIAV